MSNIKYDKILIESICNLSCDFNTLDRNLTTIKYDDNVGAFNKYYSLERITKAIKLYKAGKITEKNLANWMCIYNRIINGGFGKGYNKRYKQNISIKEIVEWEISDWLDSLSFFDWNGVVGHIEELVNAEKRLTALDKIWQHANYYNEIYAYKDDSRGGEDSIFLIINREEKKYILLETEIEFDDIKDSPHIKIVEENECNTIQSKLTAAGYNKGY